MDTENFKIEVKQIKLIITALISKTPLPQRNIKTEKEILKEKQKEEARRKKQEEMEQKEKQMEEE